MYVALLKFNLLKNSLLKRFPLAINISDFKPNILATCVKKPYLIPYLSKYWFATFIIVSLDNVGTFNITNALLAAAILQPKVSRCAPLLKLYPERSLILRVLPLDEYIFALAVSEPYPAPEPNTYLSILNEKLSLIISRSSSVVGNLGALSPIVPSEIHLYWFSPSAPLTDVFV